LKKDKKREVEESEFAQRMDHRVANRRRSSAKKKKTEHPDNIKCNITGLRLKKKKRIFITLS
jgi:hypothetical protein